MRVMCVLDMCVHGNREIERQSQSRSKKSKSIEIGAIPPKCALCFSLCFSFRYSLDVLTQILSAFVAVVIIINNRKHCCCCHSCCCCCWCVLSSLLSHSMLIYGFAAVMVSYFRSLFLSTLFDLVRLIRVYINKTFD